MGRKLVLRTFVQPRPLKRGSNIVLNGPESRCSMESNKLDVVDQHLTAVQILASGAHPWTPALRDLLPRGETASNPCSVNSVH